jgi:hypothetical protein
MEKLALAGARCGIFFGPVALSVVAQSKGLGNGGEKLGAESFVAFFSNIAVIRRVWASGEAGRELDQASFSQSFGKGFSQERTQMARRKLHARQACRAELEVEKWDTVKGSG